MVLIVHLTDLHLDMAPQNLSLALGQLRERPPDLVLVGGDNGGDDGIRQTVDAVHEECPQTPVAWVKGNHDIWSLPYTSLWTEPPNLKAAYLELSNLELDDCTVVGTYCHYDYSGGPSSIPFSDYENYRHGRLGWNDCYIDRQGKTNPEIAAEIAERFTLRYQAAVERDLPIVVLMHTLPFDCLCAFPRSFYSAYGTNSLVGRILLESARKPSVLFCGHTHNPTQSDRYGFPMINTGSDYEQVRVTFWEMEALPLQ